MIVYLAARYSRREELLGYIGQLREAGHVVNSRWLLDGPEAHDGAAKVEAATQTMPPEAAAFALDDYADVFACDLLVAFTETPRAPSAGRGGRHVEFGIALALGKRLVVVGPRENVFHALPGVEQYWTWAEALARLRRIPAGWGVTL